jgi:hypothetical protein
MRKDLLRFLLSLFDDVLAISGMICSDLLLALVVLLIAFLFREFSDGIKDRLNRKICGSGE